MKKTYAVIIFLFISLFAYSQEDQEWDDYFMPGIGYKLYVPKNTALGTYHGFVTEFVVYARAKGKASRKSGASRIKTYGNLSIMSSDNSEAKDIFYSNIGLNLSFEGKTDRKYFIPFFGLEMGGLFQRNFSTFQFTPVAGLQILSTKSVLWNIHAGYQYTNKRFDEYSGYSFSSTFNVLLWNK
ncbi:MAG: hypothetical protein M3R17_14875 [Bacteroidota bacterium]|nr:hypothetical protein [Bacteroidota bacterium]